MRRNSGLQMVDANYRVVTRLKSEYRGVPVHEEYMATYHPSLRDLPPEEFYGVLVLEKMGSDGLLSLLLCIKEFGLTAEFEASEVEKSLGMLAKQSIGDKRQIGIGPSEAD